MAPGKSPRVAARNSAGALRRAIKRTVIREARTKTKVAPGVDTPGRVPLSRGRWIKFGFPLLRVTLESGGLPFFTISPTSPFFRISPTSPVTFCHRRGYPLPPGSMVGGCRSWGRKKKGVWRCAALHSHVNDDAYGGRQHQRSLGVHQRQDENVTPPDSAPSLGLHYRSITHYWPEGHFYYSDWYYGSYYPLYDCPSSAGAATRRGVREPFLARKLSV